MTIDRFKTGRAYDANNEQIIVTETQVDGSILFADLSRHIDGVIVAPKFPGNHRAYVMRKYDLGEYNANAQNAAFFRRMRASAI